MRLGWVVLACTGCLHDRLIPCGTLACPTDATCIADRCVPDEALAACAGRADGAVCTTSSLAQGACSGGECVAPGCGNGVVEGTEVCDDGNTIGGDGCAADCSAVDTCPPIGTTPQFSSLLHRAFEQDCVGYATTEAADLAIALCGFVTGPDHLDHLIAQAEPDVPLVSAGLTFPNAQPYDVGLAPEGDQLFVLWLDNTTSAATIEVYQRMASSWTDLGAVPMPFPIAYGTAIGAPSRGPVRRMIITSGDNNGVAHEIEISGMTATELAPPFPGKMLIRANLSPDGLRAIGEDSLELPFYSDRTAVDGVFRTPEAPPGVPLQAVPTLTAGCARAYFPGFDSVLYVVQQ